MERTLNVNEIVRVKLTDSGRAELKRQHDELVSQNEFYNSPYIEPKTDKDGYCRLQLWSLMKSLGHMCIMGLELPFETDIKIDVKDNN